MSGSRRRAVTIAIVAFWVAMMGWLVWRQIGTGGAGGPGLVDELETWLAVELSDGTPAGFVHLRRVPEEREGAAGARWLVTSRLDLSVLGRLTDLSVSASAWQGIDGVFAELEVEMESGLHTLRFVGGVRDGALVGTLESGGEEIPLRFPVGDELLLGGGVGSALTLPVLEPGEEVVVDAFDATSFSMGKARLRCVGEAEIQVGGESVPARELTIDASGATSRAWIGLDGEVLRAETPFGFVLRRISAQEAFALAVPDRAGGPGGGDALGETAIRAGGMAPRRGASYLRLRIDGVPQETLPTDAWQRRTGPREWEIGAPGSGGTDGVPPPAPGRYLESDPFVQSDHPRIRERAQEIVGDVEGAEEKALRIYRWVFEEIDKEVVLSVPSALDVLERREGDCNEHTVLFTALARSVGIPTRIAIGLVWSDAAVEGGGFYYHAWPEIWTGRSWLRMDPTLGQPVADATHLKLLEGGIERWPQLLSFLGRLQIDVLEVK